MILRALLMPAEDPDLAKAARKLLRFNVQAPLAVGHVTIGEVFGGIHRDSPSLCEPRECPSVEFSRLLRGEKIVVRTIGDPMTYHRLALELHGLDGRLEPNDCLIIALALLDPGSDVLLTNDYAMAKSRTLISRAQSLGKGIQLLDLEDSGRRRRRSYGGNPAK